MADHNPYALNCLTRPRVHAGGVAPGARCLVCPYPRTCPRGYRVCRTDEPCAHHREPDPNAEQFRSAASSEGPQDLSVLVAVLMVALVSAAIALAVVIPLALTGVIR